MYSIYVQLQYIENGSKINLQIKKIYKKNTVSLHNETVSNGKRFLNKQNKYTCINE